MCLIMTGEYNYILTFPDSLLLSLFAIKTLPLFDTQAVQMAFPVTWEGAHKLSVTDVMVKWTVQILLMRKTVLVALVSKIITEMFGP